MWPNPQETEILNGKLHFLYSVCLGMDLEVFVNNFLVF